MKKLIFPFIVLTVMNACSTANKKVDVKSSTITIEPDEASITKKDTIVQPKWSYSEKEDEMTSKPIHFAKIEANEQLFFHSPYSGGTDVQLMIRKTGNSTDVMLIISQGQFLSNTGDNRYIKVRFDDETAQNYSYSEPSDYSSTKA